MENQPTKKYVLKIEKYKTIEALELDLSPGVQGFVGANAQGKTNVLLAIQELANGANDPSKIRDGEKSYAIRLEEYMGDELRATITRRQTQKTRSLDAKGIPPKYTPTTYLSKLIDSRLLNPLRLLQEDPVVYLKKHLPVELAAGDVPEDYKPLLDMSSTAPENAFKFAEKQVDYIGSQRKFVAKDLQQMTYALKDASIGLPEKLPPPPHDEAQVRERMKAIEDRMNARTKDLENLTRMKNGYAEAKNEATEAGQKHGRALNRRKELLDEMTKINEAIRIYQNESDTKHKRATYLKELCEKNAVPSGQELEQAMGVERKSLEDLKDYGAMKHRFEVVQKRKEEITTVQNQHERLDGLYKYFAYALPKKLLERADLGVEGIQFIGDTLYVGPRRIDLLSETERAIVLTRLAVSIAKSKGHLAISLDGVEIMDAKHREEWLKVARESGLKVFYTRQGKVEGDHEFLVENGKVKGDRDGKAEATAH